MTAENDRKGLVRWLTDGPDFVAAAMLLALTVVTCIDVIGRELLNAPLKGADELTVIFMAITIYAVFGSITWRENHVCVDLIDLVWPKPLTGPRQIALNLVAAAFLVVVADRVWVVAGRLCNDQPWWQWIVDVFSGAEICAGGEVTMYLRFPRGPLTYFFAMMCAIAAVCLLANCVRYLLKRGPLDTAASMSELGKHRID